MWGQEEKLLKVRSSRSQEMTLCPNKIKQKLRGEKTGFNR